MLPTTAARTLVGSIRPVVIPARYFPMGFALICALALASALIVASREHFHSMVQTHCTPGLDGVRDRSFRAWRHDTEFWPSISAVIGDNMPERAIWRFALAVAAGPFMVSYLQLVRYFQRVEEKPSSHDGASSSSKAPLFSLVNFVVLCAVFRIPSAFGYSYIASFEHLFYHELSFVLYMLFGAGIQVAVVILTRRHMSAVPFGRGQLSYRLKLGFLIGQSVCVAAVVKFFAIDHATHCIPGAYSRSNMFEWCFAFFNLAFDATAYLELADLNVVIGSSASAAGHDDAAAGAVTMLSYQAAPGADALLWVFEVAYGYMLIGGWNVMAMQVYFIPMVAMEFTVEVAFVLFAPVVTFACTKIPAIARVLQGNATLQQILTAQRFVLAGYALSIMMFFHVDVVADSGRKLLFALMGPCILLPSMRMRYLVTSAKASAVSSRPSDDRDVATFAASVASEQYRMLYGVPLGCALTMIIRLWGIGLDPFFTSALANVMYVITIAAVIVFGPLRSLLFEERLLSSQRVSQELVSAVGHPVGPVLSAAVLFGVVEGLSACVIASHGTMMRYVALDPLSDWWGPGAVIGAVLLGACNAGQFIGAKRTSLSIITAGAVVILYYGTTQSNRFFQPDPKVMEKWAMEEMSGSPLFAFFFGAVPLAFSLGAWWPQVMAWSAGISLDAITLEGAAGFAVSKEQGSSGDVAAAAVRADIASYVGPLVAVLIAAYCVCFPFVPGGELLRDRYNVLLFGFVCVILASSTAAARHFGAMQFRKFDNPNAQPAGARGAQRLSAQTVAGVLGGLTVLVTIGRLIGFSESPLPIEVKEEGGEPEATVTTGIWTIHFAMDNYGVDSTKRLTKMLSDNNVNIVGLLESDQQRLMTANRDIIEYIGYTMGLPYTDFGPPTIDSTFGCAMMSRWPIKSVRRMVLPSPMGELACMIHAKVQVLPEPSPPINVYVGHWGNTHHYKDVVLQSQTLGDLVSRNPGPSVFIGYLVTNAGQKNYYRMVQSDGEDQDDLLRRSAPEGLVEKDDGVKSWEPIAIGADGSRNPIPNIPIVKKRTGLLRDTGRDFLRGVNPFHNDGDVDRRAHAKQRDDFSKPLPSSHYWEVHAMPEPLEDIWPVDDGHKLNDDLRAKFADSKRLDIISDDFKKRAAKPVHEAYEEPKKALSMAKLQRAAEFKARKMVQSLMDADKVHEQKDVPKELRKAVAFLDEHTHNEGRNSTTMVYVYPNTGRVSMRHPRYEYEDRYCQYVLYRSMPLHDWYRILDIDELSDTELQVATFKLTKKTVDFESYE